jgi:hypothetical protein
MGRKMFYSILAVFLIIILSIWMLLDNKIYDFGDCNKTCVKYGWQSSQDNKSFKFNLVKNASV